MKRAQLAALCLITLIVAPAAHADADCSPNTVELVKSAILTQYHSGKDKERVAYEKELPIIQSHAEALSSNLRKIASQLSNQERDLLILFKQGKVPSEGLKPVVDHIKAIVETERSQMQKVECGPNFKGKVKLRDDERGDGRWEDMPEDVQKEYSHLYREPRISTPRAWCKPGWLAKEFESPNYFTMDVNLPVETRFGANLPLFTVTLSGSHHNTALEESPMQYRVSILNLASPGDLTADHFKAIAFKTHGWASWDGVHVPPTEKEFLDQELERRIPECKAQTPDQAWASQPSTTGFHLKNTHEGFESHGTTGRGRADAGNADLDEK